NLGIGTTTPTALLEVNGVAKATTMNATTGNFAATNLTTTQITEGNSLYFTDARASSALQNSSILRNGTDANFATLNVTAKLNAPSTNLTTTQITEGGNLYYTDVRVANAIQNSTIARFGTTQCSNTADRLYN